LGPDIIDPRQMDLIRRQAELAAAGKPYGVRELPPVVKTTKAIPSKAAKAAVAEVVDEGELKRREEAARRRQAVLARKRARDAAKGV
jgi:hypothetical protein